MACLKSESRLCYPASPSIKTSSDRPKPCWSISRRRKRAWPCSKKTTSANCTSSAIQDTAWWATFIWAWCGASCPGCRARLSTSAWNARPSCTSSTYWNSGKTPTKPSASNTCCSKGRPCWCRSSKTRSTAKGRGFPPKFRWPDASSSTCRRKNTSAFPNASKTTKTATTCATACKTCCRRMPHTATSSAPARKPPAMPNCRPTSTT